MWFELVIIVAIRIIIMVMKLLVNLQFGLPIQTIIIMVA